MRIVARASPAFVPRVILAHALARAGAREESESVFKEIDPRTLPRDSNWLAALALLAEVTAHLRVRDGAEELYAELLPYRDLIAMQGWFGVCFGSVERPLALLARTLGRDAPAREHFEIAIRTNEKLGAQPWTARCELEYARLLERGDRRDRARASRLLTQAARTAERLGVLDVLEGLERG